MSFVISWIAVKGKEPHDVLDALGLIRTGQTTPRPESPVSCLTLPENWFLVVANQFDSLIVAEDTLHQLSAGCQLVSCRVNERYMVSMSSGYHDGKLLWAVKHEGEPSVYHLETRGNLPSVYDSIYTEQKKRQDETGGEQSDTDYILEVPILLAQTITSYRHDIAPPNANEVHFEILEWGRSF